MVRAAESRRRDRLFDDPYAAAFLAAAPALVNRDHSGSAAFAGGVSAKAAAFWSQAVIRTRFFDDYLLGAAAGGVRQIVLVASGLDTRGYRLAWPDGVRLFELDQPDVLAFKQRVLRRRGAVPRCGIRTVAADLREDWRTPLTEAGLRPGQPTAWLLEGLLIYLTADDVTHLLATLHELSAAGSRIAFEHSDTVPDAAALPPIAEYTALWQGGLPDTPGWLTAHGWRIQTHDGAQTAAGYGRSLTSGGFLTATR